MVSCGNFATSGFNFSPQHHIPVIQVSDLQKKEKANTIVYLKGKVGSIAPFVGGGAYQLLDSTGSIWVVTHQAIPAKGDEVLIKGKVQYQTIPLVFAAGGKDLGEVYVQQQQQLQVTPAKKNFSIIP